ncbi:unnamed protein product [Schistosoma turkestanicum]|nr:unnamed protein product [Schistosoma turkestanicum]
MNAIKVLLICLCLYTILQEIEADTTVSVKAPVADKSAKISKPTRKYPRPGRSLEKNKKKSSTELPDGAVRVEQPKPEESGIILDLIAAML